MDGRSQNYNVSCRYCSSRERLLKQLASDPEETSRFPNIEFLETDEDYVPFDTRDN